MLRASLILAALWLSPAFAQDITYDVAFSIGGGAGVIGGASFTGTITAEPCGTCGPVTWTFVASDGGVLSSATGGVITNNVASPLNFNVNDISYNPDINSGSIDFVNGRTNMELSFTGGSGGNPSIGYSDGTGSGGGTGSTAFTAGQNFTGAVPDGQAALIIATADGSGGGGGGAIPVPAPDPGAAFLIFGGLLMLWRWRKRIA